MSDLTLKARSSTTLSPNKKYFHLTSLTKTNSDYNRKSNRWQKPIIPINRLFFSSRFQTLMVSYLCCCSVQHKEIRNSSLRCGKMQPSWNTILHKWCTCISFQWVYLWWIIIFRSILYQNCADWNAQREKFYFYIYFT